MSELKSADECRTAKLQDWNITDLTDALGIKRTMDVLGTSARVIYTIRHTNAVGYDRYVKLLDAVKADEKNCRERLVTVRMLQAARRAK